MGKTEFLRGATHFSADSSLFANLLDAFLESLGVSPQGNLAERLKVAATSELLDPETRAIVAALADGRTPPDIYSHQAGIVTRPLPSEETPPESEAQVPDSAELVKNVHAASRVEVQATAATFEPSLIDWSPPSDDAEAAGKVVMRFQRALVAFIQNRLTLMYGDAWLRRGCGKLIAKMKNEKPPRIGRNRAKAPETELGLAHIAELGWLMTLRENWPAFRAYYDDDVGMVTRSFDSINAFRVEADHALQRKIYLAEELDALSAMIRVTKPFHPATAEFIDAILQEKLAPPPILDEELGDPQTLLRDLIMTNLGVDFEAPEILGRDDELKAIDDFWADPTRRVLSIVGTVGGGGGIGKTALLESFITRLLKTEVRSGESCSPAALIYLSAKETYYPGIHQPLPEARRFRTLRRVFETFLEVVAGEEDTLDRPMADLQAAVYALAGDTKSGGTSVLFALDNLETLPEEELDEIGEFLTNLPNGCKAILTTRDDRRTGRRIALTGLSFPDSLELIKRTVHAAGIPNFNLEDDPDTRTLFKLTSGVPLHVKFCANLLVEGMPLSEAVDSLRGAEGLALLEFSFESSLASLSLDALAVAYYLAISRYPVGRGKLLTVLNGNEEMFKTVHNRLLQLSFVERTAEEGKQVKFQISSPLLKEHLVKRGRELLPEVEAARLRSLANVSPEATEPIRLMYEVDRALQSAASASVGRNWPRAIEVLEQARKKWGDDRRLLAQLGYYYYRSERLGIARELIEMAILKGHETADTYTHLALVLLYERRHQDALDQAELAIELNESHQSAHQVAGQALLHLAALGRLSLDSGRKTALLASAKTHLEASIRSDVGFAATAHNERTQGLLDRVNFELEELDA